MSRILTGDKLIESIRNRTMAPDDTSAYTDEDILKIANEELDTQILEKILSIHEEHLVVQLTVDRNDQGIYEIPYRAIGNKVRDVVMLVNNQVYEMTQINLGELADFRYDNDSSGLDKFYVQGNKIVLLHPTRSYDKIQFFFYLRPNVVTKVNEASIISSIVTDTNAGTVTIQLSQVGKKFNNNVQFDIVAQRTPNNIKAWDLTATSTNFGSGASIVFSYEDLKDVISSIRIGDYVTIAEQSPVPNIPTEMHPLLAQAAAIQLLEALGDNEGLQNAMGRMNQMTNSVQSLIDNRVELSPQKIKPRHTTLDQAIRSNRISNRRGR